MKKYREYHCSFCEKMPECTKKDNKIHHSSYCETFKERIKHDDKEGFIDTDCLIILDYKTNKLSGRGILS